MAEIAPHIGDALPAEAKPNERAVLIVYHCLHIKGPQDIAKILNRDISFVYKTLKKFSGLQVHFVAPVPQYHGRGFYVSGQ